MHRDQIIFDLIREEKERQTNGLELIASENYVSEQVMEAAGSVLTNKYAEGYPGKRYYGGCEVVDQVEQIAIDRAKALFNAEYVNVQPHSGSQANAAAYQAVLKPGDTILIPGKLLAGGIKLEKKVNIIAFDVSESAQKKVIESGSKLQTIEEVIKKDPKGSFFL